MGIMLQGHDMDKDSTDFYEGGDDAEEIFKNFFFGGGMAPGKHATTTSIGPFGFQTGPSFHKSGRRFYWFQPKVACPDPASYIPAFGKHSSGVKRGIAVRRYNTGSRDSFIRCLILICFRSKDCSDHLQFRSPYGSPSKNDETNGHHGKVESFIYLKMETAGMVMSSSQEIVELPESRASIGGRREGRYGTGLKYLPSLAKVMSLGEMV